MITAKPAVLEIDAHDSSDIGVAGADAFVRDGLLSIRGLLHGEELAALQDDTATLIGTIPVESGSAASDVHWKTYSPNGNRIPCRIEHVVEKSIACRRLLAHPFVLSSLERLLGPDIHPTWNSMVFKQVWQGVAIPWHRDQGRGSLPTDALAGINVDIYLDDADSSTCLRGIAGSQRWSDKDATARASGESRLEFFGDDIAPLVMQAGDVLLHDVFVLHGSPESHSYLRRVLYFEYRNASSEAEFGPHTADYVVAKRRVLEYCRALREGNDMSEAPPLRIPHENHWRPDSAFVPGHDIRS